jgi:hypothetical protein
MDNLPGDVDSQGSDHIPHIPQRANRTCASCVYRRGPSGLLCLVDWQRPRKLETGGDPACSRFVPWVRDSVREAP